MPDFPLPATPAPPPVLNAPRMICNLADGNAQSPTYNTPPVPVLSVFGDGQLCECLLKGSWDFDRAIAEKPGTLARCVRKLGNAKALDKWSHVLFKFGERAFLHGDASRIVGYAGSPDEAERLVREFTASYGTMKPPTGGSFQLIRKEQYNDITSENVDLGPETVLSDEVFDLHYPAGTGAWHRGFLAKLTARKNGLAILEGSPGTGKTSYLRHLMGQLKDTHRFYFIAPTCLKILEEPEFIGFWSSERAAYSDRMLVVILEDADDALMTRETDNRDKVSAILNLSDGMLSDFLRLHVICTINCTAAEIDPALLRPGRLVSHRVFKRLDIPQATALASSLGKTLPPAQDYSLAEVFTEDETEVVTRLRMGFSA